MFYFVPPTSGVGASNVTIVGDTVGLNKEATQATVLARLTSILSGQGSLLLKQL